MKTHRMLASIIHIEMRACEHGAPTPTLLLNFHEICAIFTYDRDLCAVD